MQRHPLCELFPPMSAEEYAVLKADLKERGYDVALGPIMTYEGKILDGANRWRACRELSIEPKISEYRGDDALGFVIASNKRRQLDDSQRAMIADKIATLKQGKPGKDNAQIKAFQPDAAKLLNVSRTAVQAARSVREYATPELVQAVERGLVAVSAAKQLMRLSAKEQGAIALEQDKGQRARLIKQGKRKAKSLPKPATPKDLELTTQTAKPPAGFGPYSVEAWGQLTASDREKIIASGFDRAGAKLNKQSGDSIEWARWSHNTVTGCLHNCPYCYARDFAERAFSYKFTPMFHPARLSAPAQTPFPATEQREDYAFGNIFANSMSDLFGQWVPADWIGATLEMARRNPKWRFLTLTKFPQRANEFEFPDNVWMGTTVDGQARVANAEAAFATIRCKTKWLSVEPLLGPLKFAHLDRFQWVVIGGASGSTKTPEWVPNFDWVTDLQHDARAAGCRIYHKTNLGLSDTIRIKEFPWMEPKPRVLPKSLRYFKGL